MLYFREKSGKIAFTLIELLMVISIIALLASILFPALNKAKAKVREISCSSNLRQVGVAISSYLSDNNLWLPGAKEAVWENPYTQSWTCKIWPYMYNTALSADNDFEAKTGRDNNVFTCPATRISNLETILYPGPTGNSNKISYGLNTGPRDSYISYSETLPTYFPNATKPAQWAMVVESSYYPGCKQLYFGLYGLIPHQKFMNSLYGDGHVANIYWSKISHDGLNVFWFGK
ncbi:MAG: hypothetical protein A2020_09880 [Lentisphaerae bacterium GWF2_45_14]|nr:MAG: hypothetical protein A2020_09880 [Lentisphaerae bacterium GWF2_45_14]